MSAKLDRHTIESRAEVLLAMDTIVKHINDEEEHVSWLVDGIPDGGPELELTAEQLDYYGQFTDDKEFEDMVLIFARTMKRVFFKTVYKPKGVS